MSPTLRILHVEDNRRDSDLVKAVLTAEGMACEIVRVDTQTSFTSALEQGEFNLIISDLTLPSFDGFTALLLARTKYPFVPFIFFSGTMGEEEAVKSLREGATDYVLKQRPTRLGAAVQRALHDAQERAERRRAEEKLRQSEELHRLITENITDLVAVLDAEGRRLYNSPSYKNILGDPNLLLGTVSFQEIHPEDRERIQRIFRETVTTGVGQRTEFRFLLKDGSIRFIESQGSLIKGGEGNTSPLVIVVSRDVTERKRADQVKHTFGQFVTPEVADFVLTHPDDFWKRGERKRVTILFTDVRNFSSFSARVSPEEVVRALNDIFVPIIEAVQHEGGTLNKFIGDGLMALFGVPIPNEDHALSAARAALRARDAIETLAASRHELNQEPLRIGIGVNSGEVVAGSVGTRERVEYSVIGHAVNLAARLEEAAAPGQILLGPETVVAIKERFDLSGTITLKLPGIPEPVPVTELLGEKK